MLVSSAWIICLLIHLLIVDTSPIKVTAFKLTFGLVPGRIQVVLLGALTIMISSVLSPIDTTKG
jgi:hypothetical protein